MVHDLLSGRSPALPNMCFSIVDVRDVARAHVLALEDPELEGRFIVYQGSLWMSEMAEELRKIYPDRRIATRRVPDLLMYLLSAFDKRLSWTLLRRSLGVKRRVDAEKSRAQMGLDYLPLDQTLRDTAESFERLGLLP
jgi:dihydroflavonol-4-reductase